MTHFDLFSGIGGFALAAKWAEIETIGFCEIDAFCQQVLSKHWPNVPVHKDVTLLNNLAHVDLLTAGFPCQPFSVAGLKKGVKDERYLWPHVARIIKQSKPTWFIGENVPGIISSIDPIIKDLENENYSVQLFAIPASACNAPHKRERIWIIANANSSRCHNGSNTWEKRHLQSNKQQYIKKIHSKWSQLVYKSWETFNPQEWLGITTNANSVTSIKANQKAIPKQTKQNTRMGHSRQNWTIKSKLNWQKSEPPVSGVDDGLPHQLDRNKALGNSIVPQIAFIFMALIKELS